MMAYTLNANEEYEQSIPYYQSAIEALDASGDFGVAARSRLGLVAAPFMTGRYPEAIETAKRADSWFLDNNDLSGHARLCTNLGNVYHRLDDHERALDYHSQAAALFKDLGDARSLPVLPEHGQFPGVP